MQKLTIAIGYGLEIHRKHENKCVMVRVNESQVMGLICENICVRREKYWDNKSHILDLDKKKLHLQIYFVCNV